jgi:DNA-binding LytR/AlgR family response regulator
MTISCLIIEDEPNAAKLIEKYISQIPFLQLKDVCRDGPSALSFLNTQKADVIFLDINLPGISGIELTKLLSIHNIIFITAYSQYAAESYNLNAIDYLLKPVSFERFFKAVTKTKQIIEHHANPSSENSFQNDFVFLKTGKKIIYVEFSMIMYIEGMKEYVIVITPAGKNIIYKRMKELEKSLPEYFIRVHNSYIINIQFITKIEENHVFISNARIPISTKYKEAFLKQINKRIL